MPRTFCSQLQQCQSVDDLAKKISVLDAIRWICSAFNDISRTCVKKCFWKSDIKSNTEKENLGPEENPISSLRTLITDGTEPQDYVNINQNVPTKAGFQTLDEIIEARVNAAEGGSGE